MNDRQPGDDLKWEIKPEYEIIKTFVIKGTDQSGHELEDAGVLTRHTGRLDEHGNWLVRLMGDDGEEFEGKRDIVIMGRGYNEGIVLKPTQALSLLAWLRQEETKLNRLADEQSNE